MKLLWIKDNEGLFRGKDGNDLPVDKMSKEDLLRLVDLTLGEAAIEFEDYDETLVKNQAHQIIYKQVHAKLRGLRERRQEFIDESARLYLEDYEKYKDLLPD